MITNEPAHTIFFDLGNVLLFFSLDKMVNQLADCMKIAPHILRNDQFLQMQMIPNYEKGLKDIQAAADRLGLYIEVYGPETHVTDIVRMALEK